jgi:SAM-dependent methyltransferase
VPPPAPPPGLDDGGGPTRARALAALGAGGTVLDVGAGEGAASLPLTGPMIALTAVDERGDALAELATRAKPGLQLTLVPGRWPDVAPRVPAVDVVVCAHVLYNVPDLAGFARALTRAARRLVVCELTERHPLTALNPLWKRFHGIDRPEGPTAGDAIAVLTGLGLDVGVERWSRAASRRYGTFADRVEITRRRLCLPVERAAEVGRALADADAAGRPERRLVTVWWAGDGELRRPG